MATRVRTPTVGDADAMGAVHVAAWKAAYRDGLMPDEYLDALSTDERATMWRGALGNDPRPRAARFVGESDDGSIVGFILVGPAGGEPEAVAGEVYTLNVSPAVWGSGAGSALLAAGTGFLSENGFDRAVLWVHPGNLRSCAFYRARGWSDDGRRRSQDVLGVEVPEARYSRSLP